MHESHIEAIIARRHNNGGDFWANEGIMLEDHATVWKVSTFARKMNPPIRLADATGRFDKIRTDQCVNQKTRGVAYEGQDSGKKPVSYIRGDRVGKPSLPFDLSGWPGY